MKLKAKNKHHHGMEMVFPIVGQKTISKDGIVEIEDEKAAKLLVENTDDWEYVDKPDSDDEGNDEDKDGIKSLSLEELIQVAEAAEYPKSEYKKFLKNKKLMVNYISKKKAEADAEGSDEGNDEDKENDE